MEIDPAVELRHLKNVNWGNDAHRRSVAAALVKAVCIMKTDRRTAHKWVSLLHFQLMDSDQPIIDPADGSCMAAVFVPCHPVPKAAPTHVVAFRGTATLQDLVYDGKLIKNRLHQTSRVTKAVEAVEHLVRRAPRGSRIWIAGHSLGATVALSVGRKMAMRGVPLETYLFNPPFVALPLEGLHDRLKRIIRTLIDGVTCIMAEILADVSKVGQRSEEFAALKDWKPYVFVNTEDYISMGYKGFFEKRQTTAVWLGKDAARRAAEHSPWDLYRKAMGKESEPVHLIPSGVLVVNLIYPGRQDWGLLRVVQKFICAHEINQWWKEYTHTLPTKPYLWI